MSKEADQKFNTLANKLQLLVDESDNLQLNLKTDLLRFNLIINQKNTSMKKYAFIMFAALLMFVSTINAQEKKENKAKGSDIEVRVEKMATDLGLNDAEKASVKKLFEKQYAEKKQFRNDNNKESADYKTKMKELQKKQNDELKATIGDEKFQKLQALEAKEKKAGKKPK